MTWRKGAGARRHLVGIIKHTQTKGVSFQYLPRLSLVEAIQDGFSYYTEFPDLSETYTHNVLDVFKQRLFRSERSDYKGFLDFWGITYDKKDDTLYLLAHTHGIVPTDNFEFLADFQLTKDLKIVTEIAGLTYSQVSSELLVVDDEVLWKKNNSIHDKYQVDLFTNTGQLLGHVKKVHCKLFYDKRAQNLKIKVKALDKNGIIKRAFIEIYNT